MERAVPDHRAHRASAHDAMVGPLLVPATRLSELQVVLSGDEHADTRLDIGLIAPVEALPAALDAIDADQRLTLHAVEVAPSEATPHQVLDVVARTVPSTVAVAVEVPRDGRRLAMLDALAGGTARAKLRTGGVTADLFPPSTELAAAIVACHERGIGFKATAGLHNAVHHVDQATGFVHHGYLNLLVAADTAACGAQAGEVAALLDLADPKAVGSAALGIGPGSARWRAARALFSSFGTCSIAEPIHDLNALGLLTGTAPKEMR